MAAPSTAYYKNALAKIPLHIPGVVKYDNYPAINSYGTIAQIKTLFWLDGLLQIAHKESGTLYYSFIGLVIAGGANAAFHATARRSKIALPIKVGGVLQNCYLLNDAGLNTLAFVSQVSIASSVSEDLEFKALFKSAVYAGSILSLEWHTMSGVDVEDTGTISIGTLSANTSSDISTGYIPTVQPALQPGWSVFLRAVIQNDEGTFYSSYVFRTASFVYVLPYTEYAPTDYHACEHSTTSKIIYSDEGLELGSNVYKDKMLTDPAWSGSYKYFDGIKNNFLKVNTGVVTAYGPCPIMVHISVSLQIEESISEAYIRLDSTFPVNTAITFQVQGNRYITSTDTNVPFEEEIVLLVTEIEATLLIGPATLDDNYEITGFTYDPHEYNDGTDYMIFTAS